MLKTSALKLLTVANLHLPTQLLNQIILLYSSIDAALQFPQKLTPFPLYSFALHSSFFPMVHFDQSHLCGGGGGEGGRRGSLKIKLTQPKEFKSRLMTLGNFQESTNLSVIQYLSHNSLTKILINKSFCCSCTGSRVISIFIRFYGWYLLLQHANYLCPAFICILKSFFFRNKL